MAMGKWLSRAVIYCFDRMIESEGLDPSVFHRFTVLGIIKQGSSL